MGGALGSFASEKTRTSTGQLRVRSEHPTRCLSPEDQRGSLPITVGTVGAFPYM